MSRDDDGSEPMDFERDDADEHDPRPRSHRGSTRNVPDARFTKLIGWTWASLGLALVSGVWLVANNLFAINSTLAKDAVYREWMTQQLADVRAVNDRQEEHFVSVDREISSIKGTTLRGGPEVKRVR